MAWTQDEIDKYRFSGYRYSMRNANGSRLSEYVALAPGAYPCQIPSEWIPVPDDSSSSEQD